MRLSRVWARSHNGLERQRLSARLTHGHFHLPGHGLLRIAYFYQRRHKLEGVIGDLHSSGDQGKLLWLFHHPQRFNELRCAHHADTFGRRILFEHVDDGLVRGNGQVSAFKPHTLDAKFHEEFREPGHPTTDAEHPKVRRLLPRLLHVPEVRGQHRGFFGDDQKPG